MLITTVISVLKKEIAKRNKQVKDGEHISFHYVNDNVIIDWPNVFGERGIWLTPTKFSQLRNTLNTINDERHNNE